MSRSMQSCQCRAALWGREASNALVVFFLMFEPLRCHLKRFAFTPEVLELQRATLAIGAAQQNLLSRSFHRNACFANRFCGGACGWLFHYRRRSFLRTCRRTFLRTSFSCLDTPHQRCKPIDFFISRCSCTVNIVMFARTLTSKCTTMLLSRCTRIRITDCAIMPMDTLTDLEMDALRQQVHHHADEKQNSLASHRPAYGS